MAGIAEGSFAYHLAAAALDHLVGKGLVDHSQAKRLVDEAAAATKAGMPNTPEAVDPIASRLRALIDERHKKMLDRS